MQYLEHFRIIQVIDPKDLYVEFEDVHGKPIAVDDKMIFQIERKRILLERKK